MGQTASNIDASNPQPAQFTYAKADSDNVNIERVNEAQTANAAESASDNDSISEGSAEAPENMPVPEEEVKEKLKTKKKKSKKSTEDEIDQEQAKQDLLAYLEIVGENASNLPLTWRDDPQLGRTVSTLTSKEYAKKADAFIPCDIRIIGAALSHIDRSADVPMKESMKIGEKAVEPGLTLGGPVCNALLKALYDFENNDAFADEEEVEEDFDFAVEGNLFDDDDASIADDQSLGSLQFGETVGASALTWGTLIRNMKDEMENQGYAQVPILTTSRKIDLNEPVHLLPPYFNSKLNRKFALLVGCNYKGRYGELRNSHNDVKIMKDYVVNVHGFPETDDYMKVLLDDGIHAKPTHNNIIQALKSIALRSRPGDAVFIQFAGHGGRVLESSAESDCYDEVFAPVDFHKRGLISEKTIFRSLLVRMAEDVTVTMLLDSCDTGIVFDMPFSWETKSDHGESLAKLSLNDNFSFIRCLNVVKQMYDNSENDYDDDDFDSDDEEYNRKRSSLVQALGDTLRDVAEDVEVEMKHLTKKTIRMAKKAIEAALEDDEDDYYDDRDDVGYDEPRSGSFDDEIYHDSDASDSFDSYEGRIARKY